VREFDGQFQLLKALDASKDQSYFLHRLNQAQLARTLFPLGALKKSEVRALAARIGLHNAAKKDSTGICFIGERPFREFLGRYLPTRPGPMRTVEGETVGEHIGLAFYTLGQRKGIGIGGQRGRQDKDGTSLPWFVAGKDMGSNTLLVAQGHDHPALLSESLVADTVSWIAGYAPPAGRYASKTRYRQADSPAVLEVLDETFRLEFDAPQWAATPGQSAVLYQEEVCLGGGVIASTSALQQKPAPLAVLP
jgi:tRNA-specific 2-thiouridylase